jgi:uncharacterized protein YeaO (DUF488 family)
MISIKLKRVCEKYDELNKNKNLLKELKTITEKHKTITLVYTSKSQKNNATVLLKRLEKIF